MVISFQISPQVKNNMLENCSNLSSRLLYEIMNKVSSEYYQTKTTKYDDSNSVITDDILSDNPSVQIMSESNFPDSIKDYLLAEQDVIYKILEDNLNLSQDKQLLFVEVGCGKGEYLDTICELNNKTLPTRSCAIQYLGLDLCPLLVAEGKQRIIEQQIQHFARIECMNIQDLNLDAKSEQIVFVLFPFNLFGNFSSDEMSSIYSRFLQQNYYLMISAYIPNENSKIARQIYYEQCFRQDSLKYYELTMKKEEECLTNEIMMMTGDEYLQESQHTSHVFYVSEKLRTVAWCEEHFVALTKEMCPYNIHINELNLTDIATMYLISKTV